MLAQLARVSARDALRVARCVAPSEAHLRETMLWLCRAQDAVAGGVSYGYALSWVRAQRRRGWLAAYPETTGYIIPTLLDYGRLTADDDYRARAIRLAHWEIGVQMSGGAVMAGVVGYPPRPAVFNTGQVLFGWIEAHLETGDEVFLRAAARAADYLVSEQDADGAWRGGLPYARSGAHAYDARTAWGLLETARYTNEPSHEAAAIRNFDFVLTKQAANGWFADCCLTDDERPLLHTIAYAVEGLLSAGTLLDEPRYVQAARTAADALLSAQRPDGGLAGRFDSQWRPAVKWSCLTGDAQTAVVWFRLFKLTRDRTYLDAARRANLYLRRAQDLLSNNPGIRGGIKGSAPIWSPYGRFTYLSWAAKFFADSLMLELMLEAE